MDSFSKRGRWSIVLSFLLMASAILSGCSGGGGGGAPATTTNNNPTGGSGSALQMAEKLSVVDAQSTTTGVAPLRIAKYVPGAGTDYANDLTQTWTYERSEEAFGTINEILCMIGQTQYDEMVNKGTYKTMVDKNQCSTKRDSAEAAGQESTNQSSGSTAPDYETWIVNSYRETDTSPQIIRAWITSEGGKGGGGGGVEPGEIIHAKVTVTESVSETNPYGIFTMNFLAYPLIVGKTMTANDIMFKGFLKAEKDATSGKVLLKFAMKGGFKNELGVDLMSMDEQTVLDRSVDGSTGSGTVSHSFTNNQMNETDSAKFDIAFNDNNFYRRDLITTTNPPVCLNRKSYNESAWRYGLYDSAGKRVTRNSGFPIKYSDGTKDYFGWAGYHGLWLPDSITIADGATVKKQVFSSTGPTETDYALIKKGGKLKKHTQGMLTLAEIKGIPLDYGEQSGSGPTSTWTNFRVEWDGTGFKKKAKQGTPPNYMWGDLAAAEQTYISLTTLGWGELNFWSQSLGGQVRVKLTATPAGTPPAVTFTYSYPLETTANTVVFYKEDIVYPGDFASTASFSCYDNCPVYDASTTGTGVSSSGWQPATTAYTYTFGSDMVLKDTSSSTNSLLMTKEGSGNQQWGFMSGPMFEPTTANIDSLKCNWFPGDTSICGWKAWSVLSEFYTWETGLNNWNQFTALKDTAGAVVKFDAPLQVTYTHLQASSKYDGAKFYLEYSGFGDLHGIPGVCVDGDSGALINCAEGGSGGKFVRWVPEFMIPEGSVATTNGATTTTYYVKPLEVERRMKPGADCSALTLTSYTLPDVTLWEDPAIGDIPTVTNAPAVVGGVVQ